MRTCINAILISILFFTSCQESEQKKYDSKLINRERINTVFGTDVSKILFDHLYVVVDSITYESLTNNKNWKNTYANLDTGLPNFAPIKSNTSTCYLRGYQHSIEILSPNNTYNEPVGKSGIGFLLKNSGEHFHLGVKPKLGKKNDFLLNATETVKMPLNGKERTWFKAFYTSSQGTALHTWYSFYNPNFLNYLNGKNHLSYSREVFLESTYEAEKLFHSVDTIRLACTPEDFRRIAQELGYLKCKLVKQDETVFTVSSGDIEIIIEYSNEIKYSRITQMTCNLNKTDNSVSHLGNLTITNQGTESIWDFGKLHNNNTN